MSYTVGRAAAMAGVTVRTLHHYEHIGLLVPSGRSSAGYRLYTDAEIDRLVRILYYRELGFSLDDITTMLTDPDTDIAGHLRRQHELLTERLARTTAMIAALEKEMEATMTGNRLTSQEKLEIFGGEYDEAWETEAEQRWGHTEAWRQSQQRTRGLDKQDWQRIKAEDDALAAKLVAAFTAGLAPDSAEAMDLAEEHRLGVGRFYDCTPAMHRGLADMYVADERFTDYFERLAPGLAQWLHTAIHANADRHPDQGHGWR